MTTKRLRPISFALVCVLLAAFGASPAQAQIVLDDFNDGNDSGWTRFDPLDNAVYSFPGGTTYGIEAPMPATNTFGPARAGAYLTGTLLSDFKITVDLVDWDNSSSTHQAIGIFARGRQEGLGTTDGYFFHYDPVGSSGSSRIWIDLITDEAPGGGGASLGITALDPGQDYRLEFKGVGDLLTGRVYASGDLVNPLFEVTFTDSTYFSGSIGLLVADQGQLLTGNQSAFAVFDNFTAIPEPSTVWLIGLGCVLVVGRVRRRKA